MTRQQIKNIDNMSEEELRHEAELLRTIFDATPIMFWFKDTNNVHIRVNQAAADLENMTVEEIEGQSAYDMYPSEQALAYHKDDQRVIRSEEPKLDILEKHTNTRTGEDRWLQTGKVPYRNKDAKAVGIVAFAVDITQQKRSEITIQAMSVKLEKQNQQLLRANEFISSTLDRMLETIEHGANVDELKDYITDALVHLKTINSDRKS